MKLNTSDKYKNLHLFDDQYFVQLIQHHILEYHAHFAERLISIYVWGSVHRNEAIQGVSDLDLHPYIRGPLRKTDHQWCRETQEKLNQASCPVCPDSAYPVQLMMSCRADNRGRTKTCGHGIKHLDFVYIMMPHLFGDVILQESSHCRFSPYHGCENIFISQLWILLDMQRD